MGIDVFRPLVMRAKGGSVTPAASALNQVLALSAQYVDQKVTATVVTHGQCGSWPPRSASTSLQPRELRAVAVRRIPGAGARAGWSRPVKSVPLTVLRGPVLKGGDGTHGVREFERWSGSGYQAVGDEACPRVTRPLREVPALQDESALADACAGVPLWSGARLLEVQPCALDRGVGQYREMLADPVVLVDRWPAHAGPHGRFVAATYRSGQRGGRRSFGFSPLRRSCRMAPDDAKWHHPAPYDTTSRLCRGPGGHIDTATGGVFPVIPQVERVTGAFHRPRRHRWCRRTARPGRSSARCACGAQQPLTAEPLRAPLPADGDESGTARVNLRLPAHLKARAEEAASREGLSVNAWLVRAVSAAVDGNTRPRTAEKTQAVGQSFTGWVR